MSAKQAGADVPIQPVDKPIICNPYVEPSAHWVYDSQTGDASQAGFRRPAGYWYKTERTAERRLFAEEQRDDLPLVNALRDDVRRWREAKPAYRGASNVTRDLLQHWARPDLARRLFFCQREAVETIIYLAELRASGRSSRTGFRDFKVSDEDLRRMLRGERPTFEGLRPDFIPALIDAPADSSLLPLTRFGCKMATGSGKTVVMAMLITWAFSNRGVNPSSAEFPNAVLVVCPNLTIKERLQVLRPEHERNYYDEFDLVPTKYRDHLRKGKVLVTNWHAFAPESEHAEGGASYPVVNKGPETREAFARRVLGDLGDRMPIMVLNDEGHHCWRPPPNAEPVSSEVKGEIEEATRWIEGLDRINNALVDGRKRPGILLCVDMSATPFYIQGSGYPEGRPFPWLVSDFGLVDAIESGIVKIPRLPVSDTTGRPEAKYFRLWRQIAEGLHPADRLPGRGGRPKPEVVYREAQAALTQIAGQWAERFTYTQQAKPGQDPIPPVIIIVCDNTDIAEVVFQKVSGETEQEIVTQEDMNEANGDEEEEPQKPKGRTKAGGKKTKTVYGQGQVFPEYLANSPGEKRTIRIDSKLLKEAEAVSGTETRDEAAERLRELVSTVGKAGLPGEKVRCVVSVAMLNEGWDANNVTHILGLRAFDSQLLCEQVVGRGLRRMDYIPDPKTGLLTEEYVDVYGIPFTLIPFKGRPVKKKEPEDKPPTWVHALPERAAMEMRFPVVEGYVFDLRKNLIRCETDAMEPLELEPNLEPTATFLRPTAGYQVGAPSQSGQFKFVLQDREGYYRQTHIQTIKFEIARIIVDRFSQTTRQETDAKARALRLLSRHQLFPQVYRFVDEYVRRKVNLRGCDPCELGLQKYVEQVIGRLSDAIQPDDTQGEPPLMPVLNRHKPIGTTRDVDFKTIRPTHGTRRSHINSVVLDTDTWESSAVFWLEACDAVEGYARNDHLGLVIPYEYLGVDHGYEPDFLVRLKSGLTVVLEIKGYEDNQDRAKHEAARRWLSAVNNWDGLGRWTFHVCRDPHLLRQELTACGIEGCRNTGAGKW